MSSIPQAFNEAAGWHFQAGAAGLSLRVGAQRSGSLPPCAAEAAVALDQAGELLDALAAAGLATGDWQWVAALGGLPPGGARATWQGREAQALLSLPWAALRALDGPPELPGLQWLATPAECLLAHWDFSDEELAALEPGGLVLLDGPPLQQLRARGEPVPADAAPWQLVARWEQPLALEAVMGWGGAVPPLPVSCQLVDAARPEAVRARGRLLPWGSGQALRLDAVQAGG